MRKVVVVYVLYFHLFSFRAILVCRRSTATAGNSAVGDGHAGMLRGFLAVSAFCSLFTSITQLFGFLSCQGSPVALDVRKWYFP